MASKKSPSWEVQLFVPTEFDPGDLDIDDDVVETHSLKGFFSGGAVKVVDGEAMKKQWKKTIDDMLALTSSMTGAQSEWSLDGIEIGLTLSAKGELLFIAEAGAEASVKLTLKRKPPAV
ncbi:Pepco domain-containing protein [Hydrogenophaga sp.]|uniref:Pepco domain-containing protein n=1 Tax=Hydrogenophaga sp. TaxID=1904254 RepID=UPI002FC88807